MLQGSRVTRLARAGSERLNKTLAMSHNKEVNGTQECSRQSIFAAIMPTFPYTKPHGHIFQSKNTNYILSIMANHKFGLPYGIEPRLFFASIINEVQGAKSPVLNIATMYSKLLCDLKNQRYAEKHDNEKYLYDQMLRFFSSYISCCYKNQKPDQRTDKFPIYRSFDFWQTQLKGSKENISTNSTIILTTDFYNELINFPALVDFKIIEYVCHSPIQIDIYMWLMCQVSLLKEQTLIPWSRLINQFNPDYTMKNQELKEFKDQLLRIVQLIIDTCDKVNIEVHIDGLILKSIR